MLCAGRQRRPTGRTGPEAGRPRAPRSPAPARPYANSASYALSVPRSLSPSPAGLADGLALIGLRVGRRCDRLAPGRADLGATLGFPALLAHRAPANSANFACG